MLIKVTELHIPRNSDLNQEHKCNNVHSLLKAPLMEESSPAIHRKAPKINAIPVYNVQDHISDTLGTCHIQSYLPTIIPFHRGGN